MFLGVTATVAQDRAKDDPFIDFAWQGGRSPYRWVRVAVTDGGAAAVTVSKRVGPVSHYTTTLSPEELGALRDAVQVTKFFTRADEDDRTIHDTGLTTLTVRLGEQRRTVSCRRCADLEPLTGPLWQLVAQAEAVGALERDEDIYTATSVVNSQLAGRKALQPAALKEPLLKYVQIHADRQRVEWALTALAFVTTAKEFGEIVTQAMADPKQREVLLTIVGAHPFCGNIPVEHWRALCPVYLAFVSDARPRQDKLTKAEAQALGDFTQMLGETRYAPAIPVLKTWFETHEKPYVDGSFTPLAKMGAAGVRALAPYLGSPEESYRHNAIELLVIASRTGPKSGFADPLPAPEYAGLVVVLTNTVLPQLRTLAEQDASPKVRTAASKAVTEIQQRIEENSK